MGNLVAAESLNKIAKSIGANVDDVNAVIRGMIVSAKRQNGAVASDAEVIVASSICAKYDLNPMINECAAFVSSGKLQFVPMIDGWYKIVNRQPNFDGVEMESHFSDDGKLTAITCRMFLKNRARPVSVTEYMDECRIATSEPWKKYPARMLRHRAYIQCARMAFGLSDISCDEPDESQPMQIKDVGGSVVSDYSDVVLAFSEALAECQTVESVDAKASEFKASLGCDAWAAVKSELIDLRAKKIEELNSVDVFFGDEAADDGAEFIGCEE